MATTAALDIPAADSLFAQVAERAPSPLVSLDLAPDSIVNRQAVIDGIMQLNRGTTRAWLSHFDDDALRDYLAHLQAAATPRGRAAIWVRTSHAPAITIADAPE